MDWRYWRRRCNHLPLNRLPVTPTRPHPLLFQVDGYQGGRSECRAVRGSGMVCSGETSPQVRTRTSIWPKHLKLSREGVSRLRVWKCLFVSFSTHLSLSVRVGKKCCCLSLSSSSYKLNKSNGRVWHLTLFGSTFCVVNCPTFLWARTCMQIPSTRTSPPGLSHLSPPFPDSSHTQPFINPRWAPAAHVSFEKQARSLTFTAPGAPSSVTWSVLSRG